QFFPILNKKIQKQLKKANITLAHELKECKTILTKTSKSLGESISVRDSCLIALQTKQTEFQKYKAFNDRTINYDKLEHHFRAPTAQDMEILIQTCLMPLAIKTQNDSFKFVHELKQEMHADLKYVESLENEIDELEYDKAEFSDMYDVILQECVSKDVMCSYLMSLSDLDVLDELQYMYLHKSWLWHQRLSHLNFDTINDLAKNDLFSGLPKFKYAKEHICPSCEQGKTKRASNPPKPVLNSKQWLHLLHMDLCGPMRVASINGFLAQSAGSSNTDVLELPCLLVLITETSQSRQHVSTSLIHIESRKLPTKSLFVDGSTRISIFTVNTKGCTVHHWVYDVLSSIPEFTLVKTDSINADHAGCIETRKSTSGGIQFLGDKLVSWMSKKQNFTAMSLAEAEYVALSASCAQVTWMRTQLQDYGFNYNKITLYCDSQSAIAISCNLV
nr:uncharacterized mitochondrial protein AtMg00810-like [Tanacetum cinerariifolium]